MGLGLATTIFNMLKKHDRRTHGSERLILSTTARRTFCAFFDFLKQIIALNVTGKYLSAGTFRILSTKQHSEVIFRDWGKLPASGHSNY
jgi:hypothetical protein